MQAGLATDRWKRTPEDYLNAAKGLFGSMSRNGFMPVCAVPIDPDGEILGGAHRVACALALELKAVPVEWKDNFVWAPPWGIGWFEEKGMWGADLKRLESDWQEMNA